MNTSLEFPPTMIEPNPHTLICVISRILENVVEQEDTVDSYGYVFMKAALTLLNVSFHCSFQALHINS